MTAVTAEPVESALAELVADLNLTVADLRALLAASVVLRDEAGIPTDQIAARFGDAAALVLMGTEIGEQAGYKRGRQSVLDERRAVGTVVAL